MSSKPRKLGLFTMKPTLPVLFLFILCIFAAIDTRAATLTVTKVEDTNDGVCDADCSLREAVAAAASGDTVVFSSLFNTPQTITLALGQINITQNLTITGTGPSLVDISANLAGRIFLISGGLNTTMSGMKMRDGRVGMPNPGEAYGGAIAVSGNGPINLSDMEFTNNQALGNAPPFTLGEGSAVWCDGCTMTLANLKVHDNLGYGAAIQADHAAVINISNSIISNNNAGVSAANTVTIQNTTLTGNTLGGIGAGNLTLVDSYVVDNPGGGIAATTISIIEKSIVSENTGGGIIMRGSATIGKTRVSNNQYFDSGGGIVNGGTMYVNDSVISGNSASLHGGGIATYGHFFLTNSTATGNTAFGAGASAGYGGGIYVYGTSGRLTLTNSTITNNQSKGGGGGIRLDNTLSPTIRNSIIAGNTSINTDEEDVSGTFMSQGTNLVGNTTGSSGWIASDLLNLNPMLGLLAENGGATMTHALLPDSPAINAGNNAVAIDPQTQMPLTTDQRGFLRFYGGASSTVDIGAYEVQPEITGTITYGNAMGSPTPRFVSGVLLTAMGSPNVTATSRADGTYTLGGFGSGAYTVTPSKTGGANGISSFDSALIAKHVAGITPLTGNQLIVADVSGNGTLSSFDAGQIARYTVGINGFGSSGNWVFVPASRAYSSVNSTQANEDFLALLMGDVSGNWSPVGSRPSAEGIKDARVESYALTDVRASATGGHFATQECEGPVGNIIVTTARMCKAFAEARADAKRDSQNRLRERAASLSGKRTGRPLTEAVPTGAAANSYPIMARKDLQPSGTAGGSDKREIDRLIGESLEDYCNRIFTQTMEKAKARARTEEELRKCLPKEGELPSWTEDWVANVWNERETVPVKQDQPLTVTDPVDPNVMWRVGSNDPKFKSVKDIDGCLFKSIDGGAKWERLHHTYMNQWKYVSSLAVTHDPNGKTILLAGVMNESFSVASDSGIMRSDDGGQTWYRVCDGYAALSVAFDPENPQNAIAEIVAMPGMDHEKPFATSRVVFSTDGGKHWMTALQNGISMETNAEVRMQA